PREHLARDVFRDLAPEPSGDVVEHRARVGVEERAELLWLLADASPMHGHIIDCPTARRALQEPRGGSPTRGAAAPPGGLTPAAGRSGCRAWAPARCRTASWRRRWTPTRR